MADSNTDQAELMPADDFEDEEPKSSTNADQQQIGATATNMDSSRSAQPQPQQETQSLLQNEDHQSDTAVTPQAHDIIALPPPEPILNNNQQQLLDVVTPVKANNTNHDTNNVSPMSPSERSSTSSITPSDINDDETPSQAIDHQKQVQEPTSPKPKPNFVPLLTLPQHQFIEPRSPVPVVPIAPIVEQQPIVNNNNNDAAILPPPPIVISVTNDAPANNSQQQQPQVQETPDKSQYLSVTTSPDYTHVNNNTPAKQHATLDSDPQQHVDQMNVPSSPYYSYFQYSELSMWSVATAALVGIGSVLLTVRDLCFGCWRQFYLFTS